MAFPSDEFTVSVTRDMGPESVDRLNAFFDRAASSPPETRAAIIEEAHRMDPMLGTELESLLAAHDNSEEYFEKLSRVAIGPAISAVAIDASDSHAVLRAKLEKILAPAYRIEREMAGGMSRVFLATELRHDRQVVIKVLPPEMSLGVSVERFQREIQLSARLQHPHIVHVLTSDAAGGLLYYVMPYVDGETLRTRISRDGALPLADAIAIWRDLLDALGFAHERGVVHRDVKPENILLSGRHAFIADFGIARALEAAADQGAAVTASGLAVGTPSYMAPEQVLAQDDADQRVDIYSAGLVMYEMLTGHAPFAGRGSRETLRAHVAETPPELNRSDVPPALVQLIVQCLAKKPDERPQSADIILRRLENLSDGSARESSRRNNRAWLVAAAGVTLVMMIGIAYIANKNVSSSRESASAGTSDADQRPSLVVLPLANRSTDPNDATLADGMTEELIGVLSKNSGFRVIASTSAFSLKGTKAGVRQIAESLHVSHVLEGSLQKVGPRVRIQVRLVDAGDGSTRWSEVYDRQMTDIFNVEDDISRAVASELYARLGKSEPPNRDQRRYTRNVAAYEWYLRGMDQSLVRSDSGTRKAIEYFNRAILGDSNFAAAYAGLARTYVQRANAAKIQNREPYMKLARAAALKAVSLDSSVAEGWSALGWVGLMDSNYPASENAFKKGLALNSSATRLHEGLARVYMVTNRPADQLAEARLGLEIDPYSVAAIREVALALIMNRKYDEAIRLLRPLKSVVPPAGVAGIVAGQAYAAKGMWPEAIAEYRWAITHASGASGPGFLGHALARAGQEKEARQILADLLSKEKDSHGAFGIAIIYAGLRDYDKAFEWLGKAADEHSIVSYIVEPMFDDLHSDPRYREVMNRLHAQNR
jgi:serine/threonine protein kinase/tetratricopeptide (TPR) repeat protein